MGLYCRTECSSVNVLYQDCVCVCVAIIALVGAVDCTSTPGRAVCGHERRIDALRLDWEVYHYRKPTTRSARLCVCDCRDGPVGRYLFPKGGVRTGRSKVCKRWPFISFQKPSHLVVKERVVRGFLKPRAYHSQWWCTSSHKDITNFLTQVYQRKRFGSLVVFSYDLPRKISSFFISIECDWTSNLAIEPRFFPF